MSDYPDLKVDRVNRIATNVLTIISDAARNMDKQGRKEYFAVLAAGIDAMLQPAKPVKPPKSESK